MSTPLVKTKSKLLVNLLSLSVSRRLIPGTLNLSTSIAVGFISVAEKL